MRFGSVCSGIEAATVALSPLGFEAAWLAEVEPFCCALLKHYYPEVPNLGDITQITEEQLRACGPVDLVCGGTPCQSFSVAGLRKGLDDPRGNLALRFLQLVGVCRPAWVLWENVPGVRSSWTGPEPPSDMGVGRRTWDSRETSDFGCFLEALGQLGYGWAYRSLDAQYCGLAQRRERVFVVGYLGDWRRSAAVLFERDCLCGNPPPSREAGARVANSIKASAGRNGGNCGDERSTMIAGTLDGSSDRRRGSGFNPSMLAFGGNNTAGPIAAAAAVNAKGGSGRMDFESETMVVHALRADGFDASEDGTGRGTPIIPIDMRQASRGDKMTNNRSGDSSGGAPGTGIGKPGDPCPSLAASHTPAIAFDTTQITSKGNYSQPKAGDPCHPLAKGAHPPAIAFYGNDDGGDAAEETAPTLRSMNGGGGNHPSVAYQCHGTNVGPMGTLRKGNGSQTGGVPFIIQEKTNDDESRGSAGTGIGGKLSQGFDSPQIQASAAGGQSGSVAETEAFGHTEHGGAGLNPVAFQTRIARNGRGAPEEICPTLQGADAGSTSDMRPCVQSGMQVRRLTPREAERLQGFPDDYTLIPYHCKPAADGPRYRALGNSWAVPVVRWIGTRILEAERTPNA